ncbi:MAG: long-chain fatty acid--CoA ligase [Deltaproteobacteria bacterium]|nr:long-chain fatty acid--CoA ligase [Deltaproteobacteria bacterium]
MISEWVRRCLEVRRPGEETLADVLAPGLALRPDAPAIHFEDRVITPRELDAAANRVAAGLVALGVQPGDRVAIHVDNRPEFVEVYQGVMRAAATLVPTNVMYTAEELEHIVGDSGARVVFVRADLAGKLEEILPRLPGVIQLITIAHGDMPGDYDAWKAASPAERPARTPRRDDLAFIQYTSGTTGKPKGAMISHGNVLAVIDGTVDLPGAVPVGEDDVLLLVLPLFHAYALNLAMNRAFLSAVPFVLVARFDADRVMTLMARHRVTVFYGAPPMYFAFVNTPGLDHHDLSSLRMAFSGAAPLPVVILERFQARTGVRISEGYGLSETAPSLCANAAAPENRPGTVGVPIPGVTLRIVDDEDRDVTPGEVGEIVARGPNIFRGYWNRPEETAEALRGGWFHTGDLGRVDERGYVTIVDRKKDMILVSGYNVYPIEVENVLLRHPGVLDVAVIGVKDEYQGESVKAVVVPRPGATPDPAALSTYCREHLAAFKVPRYYELTEALPKSPTGKVLKRELRGRA